jgi:hypothetical protein
VNTAVFQQRIENYKHPTPIWIFILKKKIEKTYYYQDVLNLLNRVKYDLGRECYSLASENIDHILKLFSEDREWLLTKSEKSLLRTITKARTQRPVEALRFIDKIEHVFLERYKAQIDRILKRPQDIKETFKRINKLASILKYNLDELNRRLDSYIEKKDEYILKSLKTSRSIKYYYPIETASIKKTVRLNKFVSIVPMETMINALSRKPNFYSFIKLFDYKLNNETAFLEIKSSHIFHKNRLAISKEYFELNLIRK